MGLELELELGLELGLKLGLELGLELEFGLIIDRDHRVPSPSVNFGVFVLETVCIQLCSWKFLTDFIHHLHPPQHSHL